MAILFVIVIFAVSSWTIVALVRRLRSDHVSKAQWLAFSALVVIGVATGIWCAFSFEYRVGARDRLGSFPIPVVFFRLEEGQWVDFPVPEFQAWLTAFTNVITITALSMLPLWFVSWRQHRHESRPNAA